MRLRVQPALCCLRAHAPLLSCHAPLLSCQESTRSQLCRCEEAVVKAEDALLGEEKEEEGEDPCYCEFSLRCAYACVSHSSLCQQVTQAPAD